MKRNRPKLVQRGSARDVDDLSFPPPFEEQAKYLKFAGGGPPLGKASPPRARKLPNEIQSENATVDSKQNAAKKPDLVGLFGDMY